MTQNLNPRPCCFTDRKGRTWDLSLDLFVARRVDASDFSIFQQEGEEPFSILRPDRAILHRLCLTDGPFLYAVIWAIVVEQAEAGFAAQPQTFPVSPKENPQAAEQEFVRGANGAVLEAARKAYSEAIVDFFPELQIVLSTLMNQAAMVRKKVAEKMDRVNPLIDQLVDAELEMGLKKMEAQLSQRQNETVGNTSTPSPPMSGSQIETSLLQALASDGS